MLEARNISLALGGRVLLDTFELTLADAGLYLLLGPTGSGKSLLCRVLSGRQRPQRGSVVLDGQPLYRAFSSAGTMVHYASAEDPAPSGETFREYLQAELRSGGGGLQYLDMLSQVLKHHLADVEQLQLQQLAHGHWLLLQLALAVALPVRLAVLDGQLTSWDKSTCQAAAELLELTARQDKFILMSASRVAGAFPGAQRLLLRGGLPVTVQVLPATASLDVSLKPVAGAATAVIHAAERSQGYSSITSGKHFTVLGYLENGLHIALTDGLDAALAELAALGVQVRQVEWNLRERPAS